MAKEKTVEQPAPIVAMLRSDFISVLVLGAAVGFVLWLVGMLLHRFVFDVYFCQGEVSSQCASAKNYAAAAASLVAGIAGLAGLIRLRVYRPLLVIIVSMISLWGTAQISWDLNWLTGALIMALVYALAFGLYSWVARIREFWIALLVIILLVLAVRLALTV